MIDLLIPCPPEIEQAIGYEGEARYCAFYWLPGCDEVVYDDGSSSGTGRWQAYLSFINHRRVQPHLMGHICLSCSGKTCQSCRKGFVIFNFGDSNSEAEHWLLLDRQERQWSAGTAKEVHRFLIEQHPAAPPMSAQQWAEVMDTVMKEFGSVAQLLSRDIQRILQQEYTQAKAIVEWLDHCAS